MGKEDANMNDFAYYRKFRMLASEGKVEKVRHYCGQEQIARLVGEDFMLWCMECNHYSDPGEGFLSRMRRFVDQNAK